MQKAIYFVLLILLGSGAQSQIFSEIKSSIPEPISNTAVAGIQVNGSWFAYAFSGIDSTKTFNGIHPRSYKYSVDSDTWSVLPNLPSNQDRIAAGASAVRGKIYILGGYEVFSNGSEISINNLHVFDPLTDEYESDAAPIPTPIDDQVQCVYKDSLIYSVTGWSNTGNVADVWIYDVVEKEWNEGTHMPTTIAYKAFGASGTIIGDTLYFIGGAKDIGNFGIGNRIRKGYINPSDPTDITWMIETSEAAEIYRSGCIHYNNKAIWLGGSENTYNYNGIAYDGSGGVPPTNALISYNPETGELIKGSADFPAVMDLRGLAQVGEASYLSIGGMKENQKVTDRVVKYDFDQLVSHNLHTIKQSVVKIYPNPVIDRLYIEEDFLIGKKSILEIYNGLGERVLRDDAFQCGNISVKHLQPGMYYVSLKGSKTLKKSVFLKL